MARSLRKEIDRVFFSGNPEQAFDLYLEIQNRLGFGNDTEEMQIALERTMHRLAFIAMPFLSDEQIIEEFKGFAPLAFTLPDTVDLQDTLKQALVTKFFQEDRDELRDKIREAMEECRSVLTETEPLIDNQTEPGNVMNWLRIFRREVGNKRASKLEYARFFSQNPEVQKLSTFEQALLKKVINFYEYTKLRSADIEGYEGNDLIQADDGTLLQYSAGSLNLVFDENDLARAKEQFEKGEIKQWQLEEILGFMPPEIREKEIAKLPQRVYDFVPSDPESIQQAYKDFFERQEQQFGLNKIKLQDGNKQQIAEHLIDQTKKGKVQDIQDGLYTLSTLSGGIEYLIRSDVFAKFVKARITTAASKTQQELYKQSPFSPIALQIFLQIAFKDQAKLEPREAAWRVFELLKKFPKTEQQYKTLVSYDLQDDALKWRYE